MQNALYYPHIGLKNPALIKAMALFYDNIYRIVPDNVMPDDSEELHALLEEGSIGKMIDPANYSDEASREFLSKIGEWGAAALSCYESKDKRLISRLHTAKIDESVRRLFREAGFEENNHWMNIPTEIASNFMLYMATQIATKNRLSLITSDWGAWTGTTYFGLDGQVDDHPNTIGIGNFDEYSESFALFGLILNELIPINISEVPAERILEFREKRHAEISQFRSRMHDLRDELVTIESKDIQMDIIESKTKELARAHKDFKLSADVIKAKGWTGVAFLRFTAPAVLSQFFNIPETSSVILGATGLALGGICTLSSTKEELKKLNEKNPVSFLYEMNKSFRQYTRQRGGGDMNFHAFNCMEEYVND
jgi:hypothetical protein